MMTFLFVTTLNAQTKTAHINSQKIMDTMPSRKKVLAELKEIERKSGLELQEMNASIEKTYAEYIKTRDGMSQANREYEEDRIQKLQSNLQTRQQELESSYQKITNQLFKPVNELLRKAIENVAAKNKYTYVVEESTMWYSKGGVDLTKEVIDEVLKLESGVSK